MRRTLAESNMVIIVNKGNGKHGRAKPTVKKRRVTAQ